MITILKQPKPFEDKDEFGDILFGSEYLRRFDKLPDNSRLAYVNVNTDYFANLGKVIDRASLNQFMKDVTYICPWTENKYRWVYPRLICSLNIDQYANDNWGNNFFWGDDDVEDFLSMQPNINRVMLGHGYTEGTLPSDGVGNLKMFAVDLSNGDSLLCDAWVWYNK